MVQRRRGLPERLHVPAWPWPYFLLWTWTRNLSDLPQRPCPSRHCQRYPMGKAAPYRWPHSEQLASRGTDSSLMNRVDRVSAMTLGLLLDRDTFGKIAPLILVA